MAVSVEIVRGMQIKMALWKPKPLQDRLDKELGMRGIDAMTPANAFLQGYIDDYNRRNAVAKSRQEDAHRSLEHHPSELDLRLSNVHYQVRQMDQGLVCAGPLCFQAWRFALPGA